MEALPSPLSSRPERSEVEGSAVPRTPHGNVFRNLNPNSHPVIIRPPAPLRRNPRNDLIRVHNVARLAMHAIREINMNLAIHHLIHRRGAEMLAWIPILLHTTMVTNIRIPNDQMHRLIIIMTRA